MIHPIKLKLSNAFVILGSQPILVDTGSPGEEDTIQASLQALGIELDDLSLILHTHVHSDHVGSTQALHQRCDVPLAYHQEDKPLMEQAHNGNLQGLGFRGWTMSKVFSKVAFETFEPNLWLHDGMRLDQFGVEGAIVHTPGHTNGSISVVLDHGEAIIGDLLMGGYMGGAL